MLIFCPICSITISHSSAAIFFCLLYCWIRAKNFWPINSPFKFYNTRDFLWRNKKIQIWPNCLISYFVRGGSIYLDEPYMGKAATRADGQCVVYCKLVLYSIKSRRHEFCLLIFMECVFICMLLLKHTRNIHHFFALKALWSLLMLDLGCRPVKILRLSKFKNAWHINPKTYVTRTK